MTLDELFILAKNKGEKVKILLTYNKPPFGTLLSLDIDGRYYKSTKVTLDDMVKEVSWRIENDKTN